MSTARDLVEKALDRLCRVPGFIERPSQRHLSMLLSDLMETSTTGAFEAPTGLGKSIAVLIPAVAHGLATGHRTVIATYTNVLTEQYWRQDLPLVLSLFDDAELLKTQFLIGRQRYACLAALEQRDPEAYLLVRKGQMLGVESEFRENRSYSRHWPAVATPAACSGRLCSHYDVCFYYQARKKAQTAPLVITNHSVVIQDALLAKETDDDANLLGAFDFLVLDEAHDFSQAAANGLEFEFSESKLSAVAGLAAALHRNVAPFFPSEAPRIERLSDGFRSNIEKVARNLDGLNLDSASVLATSPAELEAHPAVLQKLDRGALERVGVVVQQAAEAVDAFTNAVNEVLNPPDMEKPPSWQAVEASRSHLALLGAFAEGCRRLLIPEGVSVTHLGTLGAPFVRRDIVGLREPLKELIWERTPWACLSATLALDGEFDFFTRTTGATPDFSEILPSPFDFEHQAAAYLPKAGAIPDPAVSRREGTEEDYFRAIAAELSNIILILGGRTLALFHSRREMESVAALLRLPERLTVLMQPRFGAAKVGQDFLREKSSSLLALRSFWTGFDAAGETCSCVALVRVPFEAPVDPPQLTRAAWFTSEGRDPFHEHALPHAKMLMRQGAGRLVRRDEDKGIVALLDPRLRTKRYGEQILANLPAAMRVFDDFADAAGWLQMGEVTSGAESGS